MYSVATSGHRVFAVTDTQVGFKARDSDSDGKQRSLWLDGPQFVRRFLLHVLPKGFRKVSHYGLYAASAVPTLLKQARAPLPNQPAPGMTT